MKIMRIGFALGMLLTCVVSLSAHASDRENFWVSPATIAILDGDSFVAKGEVIKLYGIEAPQLSQECNHNGHVWSCGMTAALDLHKMIAMARLEKMHCWVVQRQIDATVASCFLSDKDIAASMLRAGTVHTSAKATPHYEMLEAEAKTSGMGIWGSTFDRPSTWLQKQASNTSACPFRAGKSLDVKKAFAGPLFEKYHDLKPEKRFCSPEDALRAGYRPLT